MLKMSFFQTIKTSRAFCSYPIVALDSLLKRVFWHVKVGDVDHDNEWVVETLTCTQKLHYVASCFARDLTKLCIRNLFCLCAFCMDEDYENYIFSQHVGD